MSNPVAQVGFATQECHGHGAGLAGGRWWHDLHKCVALSPVPQHFHVIPWPIEVLPTQRSYGYGRDWRAAEVIVTPEMMLRPASSTLSTHPVAQSGCDSHSRCGHGRGRWAAIKRLPP